MANTPSLVRTTRPPPGAAAASRCCSPCRIRARLTTPRTRSPRGAAPSARGPEAQGVIVHDIPALDLTGAPLGLTDVQASARAAADHGLPGSAAMIGI